MNEMLITLTQPAPVIKPETPTASSPAKDTSPPENTFENLVNNAIKKQTDGTKAEKPKADNSAEARDDSALGMAAEVTIVSEILILQQAADTEIIPTRTIDSPANFERQTLLRPRMETLEGNTTEAAPIFDEGEKQAMRTAPIELESEMAVIKENDPEKVVIPIAGAGTGIETKTDTPDKAQTGEVQAVPTEESDETMKTVSLSELAINSLGSETELVKLGENYDVTKPDFAKNLTDTILVKSDGETKEFELSLYPKELGKIKVNVVFESGKATVSIACETQKAQHILDSHVENIRSLVEGNTKQETVVHVQQENEESYQQENYDGRGQNRERQQEENHKPKKEEVRFFIDQLKINMLTLA